METSSPLTIPLSSYTLKQEWLLIAVAAAAVATLLTIDAVTFPQASDRGERTPLTWVAVVLTAFTHAAWISMDRARRGRTVGAWRFGAILLGPVVLAIYLIAEYRLRALYLIPAMLGVYLGVGVTAFTVSELLRR